jgi:hypothetical protein
MAICPGNHRLGQSRNPEDYREAENFPGCWKWEGFLKCQFSLSFFQGAPNKETIPANLDSRIAQNTIAPSPEPRYATHR